MITAGWRLGLLMKLPIERLTVRLKRVIRFSTRIIFSFLAIDLAAT